MLRADGHGDEMRHWALLSVKAFVLLRWTTKPLKLLSLAEQIREELCGVLPARRSPLRPYNVLVEQARGGNATIPLAFLMTLEALQ